METIKDCGKLLGLGGVLLALFAVPLVVLLTIIAIPFTFFIGWLEGKIAIWIIGSHIIGGLHALGITQITASNFPVICGAISVITNIVNPIHISNNNSNNHS